MLVISATREAGIGRIEVLSKKDHEILSQPIISWVWWHAPVIPAMWEEQIEAW
jgi:hypothetical protein